MYKSEKEVRYSTDIRPLFRDSDIAAMAAFGPFDLGKYDDVVAHHEAIQERLRDGSMPCDGAWPEAQILLYEQWVAQGMLE